MCNFSIRMHEMLSAAINDLAAWSVPVDGSPDYRGNDVLPQKQRLKSDVATLSVSTDACQRDFGKINTVCFKLRSPLSVAYMSILFVVNITGRSPVTEWNPLSYDKRWMVNGRRHAHYVGCPERHKMLLST